MQSKVVIDNVQLPIWHLKPGTNARQCAARGIQIVEQSIRINEWVDQNLIYVTVDPASEVLFKDCLMHYKIKQCLSGLPEGVSVDFDDVKATWLVEECSFVLFDGHHRVIALQNLHKSHWEGLPNKVRFAWDPIASAFLSCISCGRILFLCLADVEFS